MRRKEIDILLEALDKTTNSNSYWITLGITEEKEQLETDIIQHLRTGCFHFELVKEDLHRGFNDYSEMIFPKGFDTSTFLQKPGNVWNGAEELTIDKIDKSLVKEIIIDLLTGEEKCFSRSHLGTQIKFKKANQLVNNFFKALDENGTWEAYNIKPDFLNQVDDYYNTNFIQLGYFENNKRDLALAIKYEDEVNILLTNGYG
ncbi:hypothetical protein [Crocinitomix algicola]|uniref:hypothetical protein n=1 Tax=Crocinitomix algicola TaxID=1740263 RepID=UPI000872204F|nr:hypothetical protein [Crocinitomix algicola]